MEVGILSTKQVDIIKNHLALVFKYDKTLHDGNPTSEFCLYLYGMLAMATISTAQIKSKLSQCFAHEIDNATYGNENAVESKAIHDGSPYPSMILDHAQGYLNDQNLRC